MTFSLSLLDYEALAPGLDTPQAWQAWSQHKPNVIDPHHALPKCPQLPMMTARRLNPGARLAVNCGLSLYKKHAPDAIVFCSRHGELHRNQQILSALAQGQDISPTTFTMSVHNAAVGSLAIIAKATVPTSSVSAGQDSFQQAFYEVMAFFQQGLQKVLLVDFDDTVPSDYREVFVGTDASFPYACAFVLEPAPQWHCHSTLQAPREQETIALPQSLQCLAAWLRQETHFTIASTDRLWHWGR